MLMLWRATDERQYTGRWSCWAERRADAEAYRDNPGFGGAILLRTEMDADDADVLDLADYRYPRQAMAAPFDALYPDADANERYDTLDDWATHAYEYEVWENRPDVAKAMEQSGYRWIVYQDDFPHGAITWVYRGAVPLVAQVVTD